MATRAMTQPRQSTLGSDTDISDGMTEIELQKLQRQYRIMEGDRKAYSEESRILITKQRANVEKLKRDNQQLLDQLAILQQRNGDPRKRDATRRAEAMAEQAEMYQRKVRQIAAEIASLDESINNMDREVDTQRKKLGERSGVGSFNSEAVDKQIRVLENRLDKALIKYNKALTANKALRSTIDSLRRERLVFDSLHRKFERDLLEEKRRVAEVVEASNAAYEARDEAQAKIVALRERAEKEGSAYAQEIKELDRALEQDKRLKEFMAAKVAERMKDDHGGRRAGNDKDHLPAKLPSAEALAESIKIHENALTELRQATGCADASALVERFRASEDECFSLFAYVAEVHGEAERAAAEVDAVRADIRSVQADMQVAEETRHQQVSVLEERLRSFEEKSKHYERAEQELAGAADALRRGIEGLITKLPALEPPQPSIKASPSSNLPDVGIVPIHESEEEAASPTEAPASQENVAPSTTNVAVPPKPQRAPSSELLEAGAAVTDATVLAFLAALERRANQLLTLNFLLSPRRMPVVGADGEQIVPRDVLSGSEKGAGLLGVGPSAPLATVTIVAPSTGDDHDSEDDEDEGDERPLTREELMQKTMRVLSRREKSAAAGATKVGSGSKSRRKRAVKKE
ncbi:hypothetical protein SmJEL517_g04959 [Synchytrium microbalum]|uniref:ODAD1 central coiled coil region domain-containing protein n=1 Tax=Synchytrium microbalum TaxID=1806994 RepID=A0A507C2P8_9FUNG|nr:uncharacterized protein SmJEL517_g04959 [Synchytrium microbalum]TPX31783.1 hypothetical protein SmJEL517_g04959 [Synchytrium microbalum]